jgi:hypothetical protein
MGGGTSRLCHFTRPDEYKQFIKSGAAWVYVHCIYTPSNRHIDPCVDFLTIYEWPDHPLSPFDPLAICNHWSNPESLQRALECHICAIKLSLSAIYVPSRQALENKCIFNHYFMYIITHPWYTSNIIS